MEVAKLKDAKGEANTGRRKVAANEVAEERGSIPANVKTQSKVKQNFSSKKDETDVPHGKTANMKKLFNGIIGSQMKHAKSVIEGVKEHLRCTAKQASKNMNYPFCKSPCNIEDLKNTIYINEGEIIIKKNLYKNLFNSRRRDNSEVKETSNLKKNSNEDIFSCNTRDITVRGTHNFGFHVQVSCEEGENKIIAYAYDKDTRERIPCVYRWTRIYSDRRCNVVSRSFADVGPHGGGSSVESMGTVESIGTAKPIGTAEPIGTAKPIGTVVGGHPPPQAAQYSSEYELTCDDIGLKICVECSYLSDEQMAGGTRCRYPRNSSGTSSRSHQESDGSVDSGPANQSHCSDVQLYIDASSFKSSFRDGNERDASGVHSRGVGTFRRGDRSSGPSRSSSRNHHMGRTNERGDSHNMKKEHSTLDPYESSLREKNPICASAQRGSGHPTSSFPTRGKYAGVAVAEVGPFTLNERTKKMLQAVIQNDIIRYPLYVMERRAQAGDHVGGDSSLSRIPPSAKRRGSGFHAQSEYSDRGDRNDCGDCEDRDDCDDRDDGDHCTSADEQSRSSNVGSEPDDHLHMLHIHKNEIKLVSRNSAATQMWTHKFGDVYPYIEFLRCREGVNEEFLLHTSDSEHYVCKCLQKRHRDLIAIILRYMHANLQILNDYIFNNINESFQNETARNVFEHVDVNSILENVNRELLTNRKLNQKYLQKIKKLRGEKNMLEEDLKNTIEAFQAQLDTVKRFKDENELLKTNEHLMKEIKLLQDKYKDVDLFFKSKYKLLLNDIERYKKLLDERKTKAISQEAEALRAKLEAAEQEKNELRRETVKIKSYYQEEKRSKTELESRLEDLRLKMEGLNKSLEEERSKGKSTSGCMRELEELKKNNLMLHQKNLAISDQVNLLVTEKNRLSKMVDSLTKDIEKAKTNGGLRSAESQKKGPRPLPSDAPNQSEDDAHRKLLKEVESLRGENELLKKRIKKFSKFNSMA